jgi:restriction system protein
MAVPDFQSLFIPVLQVASDGNEHSLSETIETIAQQLGLSEADRDELLPSGKQRKFDNRVSWARTYLQKAQLLTHTGRSNVRITERGFKVLRDNPTYINTKYLKQFPEFLAFHTANGDKSTTSDENLGTTQEMFEKTSQTPQEILEASYQSLRQTLAQELLERIKIAHQNSLKASWLIYSLQWAMEVHEKMLDKLLVRLETAE